VQELKVFSSLEEVSDRLRSAGYIADSIATSTVYLAAKLRKPLLLEDDDVANDGAMRALQDVSALDQVHRHMQLAIFRRALAR